MESKLSRLFKFLAINRSYNLQLQKTVLSTWIQSYETKREKAYSLLLNVYQTQSRPSLDRAKLFFEPIYYSKGALNSFTSFAKYLGATKGCNFSELFISLSSIPGWGKKTTALFVKMLFQLNHHNELKKILFWDDIPKLRPKDSIYLPVDQVILETFRYIDKSKNSFDKINLFLKENYSQHDFEIWDDLWFWGYFNQKGAGFDRELGFNYGKYWINIYTNKNPNVINEIKIKSNRFIEILQSK